MENNQKSFARGAEWRRWDLHIHTPDSQLGNSYSGVSSADYVDKLEQAATLHQIAVIGVTDYMSIDGYEKLYDIQKNAETPRLNSVLLIPNIESLVSQVPSSLLSISCPFAIKKYSEEVFFL